MHPFRAADVEYALTRKGFERRNTHHTYFHFKYEGRDIGVSTRISQGEKEIGVGLAKRMRIQMCLDTNNDFIRFVECPLTQDDYVAMLKKNGKIA
jgi:hypothetical protein